MYLNNFYHCSSLQVKKSFLQTKFVKEIQKTNQLIIPSFVQNNTVFNVESDCVPSSDNGLFLSQTDLLLLNKGNILEMFNRQANYYKVCIICIRLLVLNVLHNT